MAETSTVDFRLRLPRNLHARLTELAAALAARAPAALDAMFRDDYESASSDGSRLRVVVDQVASLTDTSAIAWHARLCQ